MSLNPQEAYDLLREAIPRRPELRFKDWPDVDMKIAYSLHPYQGGCYIATQVFCHLVPDARPYTVDRGHFWAQIEDKIWDPTFDQFDFKYQYFLGKPTHFKNLTKRAKELLKEVESLQNLNTATSHS